MSPKIRSTLVLLGMLACFPLSAGPTGVAEGQNPPPSSSSSSSVPEQRALLENTSAAFHEVVQKNSAAVVSISAVKALSRPKEARGPGQVPGFPFGESDPFFPGMPPDQPSPSYGIGTGVVLREDGVILTSYHVVEGAERVTVALDPKRKFKARILGADSRTDVAILKIDPPLQGLQTIRFGDSDQVKVGDWAVAIGSPFGLSQSVTSGIVSAKGRADMGVVEIEDFIQTDAAINPGNSGGPLLNLNGEMIGLNAAIFSQTGGFMGIGFAVPSNLVRGVAEQILRNGHVTRGWIGITAQDLDKGLAQYFKVRPEQGALISQVAPGGPADQSALKPGDVILSYGRRPISNAGDLKSQVSATPGGSRVNVQVQRNGKPLNLTLRVREQPREEVPAPQGQLAGQVAPTQGPPELGLSVQDVPRELAVLMGMPDIRGALVVAVRPGSIAFEAGLAPGDVILRANERRIERASEFAGFVKSLKSTDLTVLYVQRGPEDRVYVPLRAES